MLYYPMQKDFVSSGKFYSAIGFSEILDRKAKGATKYNERDRFYAASRPALRVSCAA